MSAPISSASTRPHAAFDPLSKVAAVTFSFWVMKILATTLGLLIGVLGLSVLRRRSDEVPA